MSVAPSFSAPFSSPKVRRSFDALNRLSSNQDNDYRLAHLYAEIGFLSFVRAETQEYFGQTAYPLTVSRSYDSRGDSHMSGRILASLHAWPLALSG